MVGALDRVKCFGFVGDFKQFPSVVERDGPVAVAECLREEKITCPQWDGCLIKDPLSELNHKIYDLLRHTTVADLVEDGDKCSVRT